ncbi:MAG TPA: methyltransferase [Crocinitomicaceae bacterium]|nr:methyltransferase [Crocinitomicaceae bacterium]
MSNFQFKYFTIRQQTSAMKVGTDAMLLGAFATVYDTNSVLDIGAGTGVLSLMLAQKAKNLKISAVELNADALSDLKINFDNAPFEHSFSILEDDFSTILFNQTFDVIISNPPYFKNSFHYNHSDNRSVARNEENLTFDTLIGKSAKLLNENGLFWFVVPTTAETEIENLAQLHQLSIKQKITLLGKPNNSVRLIYCLTNKKNVQSEFLTFTIRNTDGTYTDEYVDLTKEFHFRQVKR